MIDSSPPETHITPEQCSIKKEQKKVSTAQILDSMQTNYNSVNYTNNPNVEQQQQTTFPSGLAPNVFNGQNQSYQQDQQNQQYQQNQNANYQNANYQNSNQGSGFGNISNMMPLLKMFMGGGNGAGGLDSLLKGFGGGGANNNMNGISSLLQGFGGMNSQNNANGMANGLNNPMLGQLLAFMPQLLKSKKTGVTSKPQPGKNGKTIDSFVRTNDFK